MVSSVIYGTTLEALLVFVPILMFSFLFRFAEPKFRFAEIQNIQTDLLDPETKKKYDLGTCGQCGQDIVIAKERFLNVLGKSEKHFCSNCGVFLNNNPFNAIFLGLSMCVIAFIIMFGMVGVMTGNSTPKNIFLLVMFFAMIDGGRRCFAGIRGVIQSKQMKAKMDVGLPLSDLRVMGNQKYGKSENNELQWWTCPECGSNVTIQSNIDVGDTIVCPKCKVKCRIKEIAS